MLSGLSNQGSSVRTLGVAMVAAGLIAACSGQALAADRGGRGGGGGGSRGGGNVHHNGGGGHGGGGWHNDHHDSHSSFSIGIGLGSWGCGPGWSTSFGYSSGYYAPAYRYGYGYSYCAPRPYCPPVVVAPYCPPPVVVAPAYTSAPVVVVREPRTVVVSEPVVVQRPVVVERQVVVEKPVVVERQVVVERPAPPPTTPVVATAPQPGSYRDRELGDAYLRLGDMDNATRVYGRYLAAWDKDGTAVRNMGLAQIATGHPQEGFRNFVTGYKLEANLIDRPLRVQDVGGPNGFSTLLDQAVRSADSLNNADGWLTVAMLQQMNGQLDAAVVSLQKSRDAGLDKDTLDSFTLALAK